MNSPMNNLKKEAAETLNGATEAVKDAARTAADTAKSQGRQAMRAAGEIVEDGKRQAQAFAENARDVAEDIAHKAQDLADEVSAKVEEMADGADPHVSAVMGKVKSTAQAARDTVIDNAGPALAGLRDAAIQKADVARESLSDVGDRIAASLSRASDDQQADALKSRAFASVANGVASASQMLRDRSVADLSADVRAMARRHPGAFIAGAAVAGFAAARFLRSSGARKVQGYASSYGDAVHNDKDLRS